LFAGDIDPGSTGHTTDSADVSSNTTVSTATPPIARWLRKKRDRNDVSRLGIWAATGAADGRDIAMVLIGDYA
jgi:hypothetical protein